MCSSSWEGAMALSWYGKDHRWAHLLKQQMLITAYRLSTKKNKLPFSVLFPENKWKFVFSVSSVFRKYIYIAMALYIYRYTSIKINISTSIYIYMLPFQYLYIQKKELTENGNSKLPFVFCM